jgi:RimJ/RimL family protein N-acetyltransferase
MLEWLRSCAASDDPLSLAVRDDESGRYLGMVSYLAIRPAMRVLELGHIWYVPRAQGTGINTEAVHLMLTEAFDVLGYRRVEWKCDSLNDRSRRAALRLGFHFEGIFRQHMIVKGKNRDTAWFAMLDSDWEAS